MSFRFRRKLSIGPIHLNLAKTGVSLTVATLISTYNFPLFGRPRPWRATVGLPGKGLVYVKQGTRKRSQRSHTWLPK